MIPIIKRLLPISTVLCSLHSKAAGASVIRGTLIELLLVKVRSRPSNSLWPKARGAAVLTMASATEWFTRLTTNSPLVLILRAVSFGTPAALSPGAKASIAGLQPKTLKNENGAALTQLVSSIVVTHAIGRGVTNAVRSE